jgi:hypothetical protein
VIRAITVQWAQRVLHFDRAQQGDLSVLQEAHTYPIAQHAKHPSTAKKLPYLKGHVRQGHMATKQALSQADALDSALQASFVLHRQINPNVVHKEHSAWWAMLHALGVLPGIPRHQKHQRGATNVRQELMQVFRGQHGVQSALLEASRVCQVRRNANHVRRDILKTDRLQAHADVLKVELPMAMVQQVLKFVVVERSWTLMLQSVKYVSQVSILTR